MNRLATETSPYLLQHARNPVDWYPWGPEALERARREDKPILLSVGYAACHWCHVMEHESFEDPDTARLMNERFVNIKVDREERPDVDAIYMQAVQAMTGHGGWPMTMFLTPEGEPFYGGTYFPPEDRHGMPSFRRVLEAVHRTWLERREEVARTAGRMREYFAAASDVGGGRLDALDVGPTAATLQSAWRTLAQGYDSRHKGFGGAPKFPPTMALDFLLRAAARGIAPPALAMVHETFLAMARGGLYDQVGGGFHRYSVDAAWLVPHFEKMLYDNALLVRLGAHLWQATGDDEVRRVTGQTVDWLLREMTSPEGGFYASLDADSEGHEGKFYVWTDAELREALGSDADVALRWWNVEPGGNFEGASILHVADDPAVLAARLGRPAGELREVVDRAAATLLARREHRVRPARDEKILASWNALMLRGLCEAARVFRHDGYRAAAVRNGEFLLRTLVRDGRVMRTHTAGRTHLAGYLEDHAALALAFLDLHALTFDARWLDEAVRLARTTIAWFLDEDTGRFFDTAHDHERLVTRPRDVTDNALPAGHSLAVDLCLRLALLTGDDDVRRHAESALRDLADPMARHPQAFGHLLGVADMAVHGAVEVALVGDPRAPHFGALDVVVAQQYVPSLLLAGGPERDDSGVPALLARRRAGPLGATGYVCRGMACDAPTDDPAELAEQLRRAPRTSG
jgi:uncharacterized protein YyaL (SSP411 family)